MNLEKEILLNYTLINNFFLLNSKMKKITLYILLFITSINLFAQSRLIDIKIIPLNRAYLFFNDLPQFTSELNEEKNKITIRINDVQILDSAREMVSTGIISEIFNIEKEDSLIASILITEPRGFTAIPLIYSQAILVDIFKWDNISKQEDIYREALLNIMSNLRNNAKQLLNDKLLSNHPNANAILGLMYMEENKSDSAFLLINNAVKLKSNIPDVFVAYGQFYEFFNDSIKALEYYDKFIEITGKSNFQKYIIDLDSNHYKFLNNDKVDIDSSDITSIISESLKAPITFQDSLAAEESFSLSNNLWVYIIATGIIIFLVIIFMYLKWRQSQIRLSTSDQIEMSKTRFDEEVKMARERSEREIKTREKIREEENKSSKKLKSKNKTNSVLEKTYSKSKSDKNKKIEKLKDKPLNFKQKKVTPQQNVKEEDQTNQLEEFLETFIPLKKAEEDEITKASNEIIEETNFDDDIDNSNSPKRPNVDLAIHLAEEKQKIKKKNIQSLSENKLDTNDSIEDIAKKMKVEKGTIETKSTLDKYSTDKQSLEKLNSKFNKYKKNK